MGGLINLKVCNSQHMLFTKHISIEPRFILVNETDYILHFKAVDSHSVAVELPPKKRLPYSKLASDNPHHKVDEIFVNMELAEFNYQRSGNINLASVGLVYFQLRHSDEHNTRAYFSCDTREEGCNVYAIFKNIPTKDAPYKFINKNQNIIFNIPQLEMSLQHDNQDEIDTKSTAYYAWDDPSKHERALKVTLEVKGEGKYRTVTHMLKVD
jgi:vacuolar protein sorting-associated protein 13A/C